MEAEICMMWVQNGPGDRGRILTVDLEVESSRQRLCDIVVGGPTRNVGVGVVSSEGGDGEDGPDVAHAHAHAHGEYHIVSLLVRG